MKSGHVTNYKFSVDKLAFVNSRFGLAILLISLIFCELGCKKFVDIPSPVTSTNTQNVYANDATAAAVLTGLYTNMSSDNSGLGFGGGISGTSLFTGLSSDELTLYNGVTDGDAFLYYINSLSSQYNAGAYFWTYIFSKDIYPINSAIEGLSNSNNLTKSVKNQLLGEAYFLRSFAYFYLVNLYGDVPLVLSTDYSKTFNLARSTKAQVYQQIIKDLSIAKDLLNNYYFKGDAVSTYQAGSEERVRPNKTAAIAMLARVYLYTNDWVKAEAQSTEIINNKSTYDTVSLNTVFLKNSKETIWSLPSVFNSPNANTGDGRIFILPGTGPSGDYPYYLSDTLLHSFENGDQRLVSWVSNVTVDGVTYNYPFKYKLGSTGDGPTEYLVVLRLAEQYLIRAESRIEQGNTIGANEDLNVIRKRAGLASVYITNKTTLLIKIIHERQVELFAEWGHRWFDLKRTNKVDEVMRAVTSQKGGTWNSYQAVYPIPLSEIQRAPNLVQNTGY